MNQRISAPARALAVIALVCGFLVVVVVVAASLGGNDGNGSGGRSSSNGQVTQEGNGERDTPKAYVVQSGDTLTSIARETGVSVAQIQRLNPGVDPQILISGEELKLR